MKKFFFFVSLFTLVLAAVTFVSCSKDDDEIIPDASVSYEQVEALMPEVWCDLTFEEDSLLILLNMSEDKTFNMAFVFFMDGKLEYEIFEGGKWRPFIEEENGVIRGGGIWQLGNEKTGTVEGKVYLQKGDTLDIRKISVTAEDIDLHYSYDKIAEAISVLPPSETRGLSEIWDSVKKKVSEGFQIFKGNPVTKTVLDWTKTNLSKIGHLITFKKDVRGVTKGNDNWMEKLPDSAKICDLSIPGTHDTFTFNANFIPSDNALIPSYALTQLMNIEGQWGAGVRMFDFRVNVGDEDKYIISHEFIPLCSLDAALDEVSKQLGDHKNETAIIVMKFERGKETDDAKKKINAAIKEAFGDKIATWKPDMTLGDARGKVIVLYRYGFGKAIAEEALGPSLSGYGDNKPDQKLSLGELSAPLFVQDIYSSGGDYVYNDHVLVYESDDDFWAAKQAAMKVNFEYAADSKGNTNAWVFNHTSGYVGTLASMNYTRNAETMAPFANDYINNNKGKKTGIVVMDFAGIDAFWTGAYSCGDKLIDTIVKNNYEMFK